MQWRDRALALDEYLHFDAWKKSAPNAYYDSPLVRRVLKSLRELRLKVRFLRLDSRLCRVSWLT